MKDKDQNLTEKIAQDGGLQTDNRMYFDPIHKVGMYGNLLQSLYVSKSHPYSKILLSFFILILPTLIADISFTQQTFWGNKEIYSDGNRIELFIYVYPLSILIYVVAFKFIAKAIQNIQVKN